MGRWQLQSLNIIFSSQNETWGGAQYQLSFEVSCVSTQRLTLKLTYWQIADGLLRHLLYSSGIHVVGHKYLKLAYVVGIIAFYMWQMLGTCWKYMLWMFAEHIVMSETCHIVGCSRCQSVSGCTSMSRWLARRLLSLRLPVVSPSRETTSHAKYNTPPMVSREWSDKNADNCGIL